MNIAEKKHKQELLKDLKAGGRRPPMPRPARFEDKTKFNRAREKRKYYADFG